MLEIDQVEPPFLIAASEVRSGLFGELQIGRRVSPRDLFGLPTLREAQQGVLANGDEHAKARLALDLRLPHETLLDERAQDVEGIGLSAHLFDLPKHRATDEHREAPEEALLARVQEVPAPCDRPIESSLALRQVPRGRREHVEALPQLRKHRLRGQDLAARRRELDRERQAVEPVHDLGDSRGVVGRDPKVGTHGHRPLDEEPDGVGLGKHLERGQPFRIGKLERRDRELLLSRYAERRAARRDDFQHRTRAEQLAHDGRRGKDLLEVIEDEEDPLAPNVIEHTGERHLATANLDAEGVRDRRWDELGVGDRRERNEERSVAEVVSGLLRDPQ